jgi:hypothetical protein
MKYIHNFLGFLNEMQISNPEVEETMSEFYELQIQIAELELQLKEKKAKFKKFEGQLTPILDGMRETKDKLAFTESYVVKIRRFGHERVSSSYKEAFELSLTKVNAATRRILNEALEATQKISKIGHSYDIEKLEESNFFRQIGDKLRMIANSFLNFFRKETKTIDEGNAELKKLAEVRQK